MLPLHDDRPARRFPLATLLIIAANISVFVRWQLDVGIDQSVKLGGLVPVLFVHSAWQAGMAHMLTSMFMHAGWMHLIGNMWFLWVFGKNTEDSMDFTRFVFFYLLCGIAADYTYVYFSPRSHVPLIGASGAIGGVLGAYLMIRPTASITTVGPFFYLIKLPAWFFLIIWFGLQVLLQLGSADHSGGGVAYLAHIGGFLTGMTLIFFFKNRVDSLGSDA
jgi:membrane associated rhomboid family serine protease